MFLLVTLSCSIILVHITIIHNMYFDMQKSD